MLGLAGGHVSHSKLLIYNGCCDSLQSVFVAIQSSNPCIVSILGWNSWKICGESLSCWNQRHNMVIKNFEFLVLSVTFSGRSEHIENEWLLWFLWNLQMTTINHDRIICGNRIRVSSFVFIGLILCPIGSSVDRNQYRYGGTEVWPHPEKEEAAQREAGNFVHNNSTQKAYNK